MRLTEVIIITIALTLIVLWSFIIAEGLFGDEIYNLLDFFYGHLEVDQWM